MTQRAREPQGPSHRRRGFARWTAELGVAVFFVVAGALVVNGSLEQGVGWTSTGPESGYFPMRIGWLIIATGMIQAAIALARAARERRGAVTREIYLERDRIKPLMQVFLPMAAYVVAIPWLGIYLASTLFIAGFMWWLGGYRWRALPTAVAISAVLYVLLEVWFRVELYKGPLAEWLVENVVR